MASSSTSPLSPSPPCFSNPPPSPLPSVLSTPSSVLTIKLSDENYILWKAQIVPYLKGHNLFGFVDGSICPPYLSDDNSSQHSWQQQDQSVMSLLISSLSESVLAHVLGASSSREIWVTLEAVFSANTQARVLQLLLQLTTLKKGSDSIADYYRRANLLLNTLALAGKTISSSEFIVYLLAGLGTDYDSVVTSITTRADPLSPAQVYSHLLTHESRLNHQSHTLSTSIDMSANASYKPPSSSSSPMRGRGYSRGRGSYRGRPGRGRSSGRGTSPSYFVPNRPTCQVCNKPGHTASACYHRFDYNYQPPPPSSLSANYSSVPNTSLSDHTWYPDTAATHHFTNDFSNLSLNPTPYKGSDSVRIGDGSALPIQNVGSSNFSFPNGCSYQEDAPSWSN